jgi:hypothetical protein
MTVYYMPYSAVNNKMTAFKPGFRMLAGDPSNKKNNNKASICHRCLGNGEGFAPCDSKDTGELPAKYCPQGIRATIIFPSCWDGVNLDSPDHRSHVAYSNAGGLGTPNCPKTHPVAIPQVIYNPPTGSQNYLGVSLTLSRRSCTRLCGIPVATRTPLGMATASSHSSTASVTRTYTFIFLMLRGEAQ